MPDFEVTHQGRKFIVTAPDMATASESVRRHFGLGPGSTPEPTGVAYWGYNIPGLVSEAYHNPRAAGRFAAQTAGTIGGIGLGGATGGPAGAIGGGAAGSVLSRQAYDALLDAALGTSQRPDVASLETGIDAVAGGAGPAVGSLIRGTARMMSGLRQADFNRVRSILAGNAEATADDIRYLRDVARSNRLNFADEASDVAFMGRLRAVVRAADEAGFNVSRDVAVRYGLENARSPALLAGRGTVGALAGAAMTGDIVGMLGGAGLTAAILDRAVPRLLQSERLGEPFARWAFNYANGNLGPAQAARALLAIGAEHQLTAPEREALGELHDEVATMPDTREAAGPRREVLRDMRSRSGNVWPVVYDAETGRMLRRATDDDLATLGGR